MNIRTIDTYFQRGNGREIGANKTKLITGLGTEPETPETLAETRPPEQDKTHINQPQEIV